MEKEPYQVSVLVPVYGVEKYIERCARSVFEQTYHNLDIVFVDDCTPDHSIDVLKRVLDEYPERKPQTRIIRHKMNRGLAAARNTAVAAATGEFIMHVDSDDSVDKNIVRLSVEAQKHTNADIVSVDAKAIFKDKEIVYFRPRNIEPHEEAYLTLSRRAFPAIWGRIIRRSLYLDNDIKTPEGLNNGEDLNTISRLLYYAKKTSVVERPLYFYDTTNMLSYSNNMSVKNECQLWQGYKLLESFFKDKGNLFMKAIYEGEGSVIKQDFYYISSHIEEKTFFYYVINQMNTVPLKFWPFGNIFKVLILLRSYEIYRLYVFTKNRIEKYKSNHINL